MVSPNTEVALLLLFRLGGRTDGPEPLSQSEWNSLARWLKARGLAPTDLYEVAKGKNELLPPIPLERLSSLLERGMAVSLAVERWSQLGIWMVGRGDPDYPSRWKRYLGMGCPPVLFGVGDGTLLKRGGLGIVGSRKAPSESLEYAARLARKCALQGVGVVSGGAKGIDSAAMLEVLRCGGQAVGVLASNLIGEATLARWREALLKRRLCLVSASAPDARFSAAAALGRNPLIYTLSHTTIVVHSAHGSGGTWSGASEALIADWPRVYVRATDDDGNRGLLMLGADPVPKEIFEERFSLSELLVSEDTLE